MGAIVVTSITFTAPRIGTFATIGLLIAGQLAMGVIIDAFGLFGLEKIPVTPARVAGLVLLAAGAALVLKRSDGLARDPRDSSGGRRSRGGRLRLQVHLQRLEGLLAAEARLLVAAERIPGKAPYGRLIVNVPDLMRRARRWPRAGSPVQTVAISP